MEIYSDIVGVGNYQVSNFGNIKNAKTQHVLKPRIRNGYQVVAFNKIDKKVHHIVANAFIPKIDGSDYVDHIDRNCLNNNASNLRYVTMQQNNMNTSKRKNTTSKYKGVSLDSRTKKWCVEISFNKKRFRLGKFHLEEDAGRVYDEKAKELFGEYANLNFS